MNSADKKLIIFDFDGVLNLNSMQAYYHCYDIALEEGGISMDRTTQEDIINLSWGASHPEIISELVKADKQRYAAVLRSFEEVLAEDFPEIIKPVPGASQMLDRLAGKYALALNTAADPHVLFERVMPKVGIEPYIFQGGMMLAVDLVDDRYAMPKPFPFTTRKLMERNNALPYQTVMVGDSDVDIRSAIEANVDDIVVPLTGQLSRESAQEFNVDIIPDVTYLEPLLGGTCLRDCVEVSA